MFLFLPRTGLGVGTATFYYQIDAATFNSEYGQQVLLLHKYKPVGLRKWILVLYIYVDVSLKAQKREDNFEVLL